MRLVLLAIALLISGCAQPEADEVKPENADIQGLSKEPAAPIPEQETGQPSAQETRNATQDVNLFGLSLDDCKGFRADITVPSAINQQSPIEGWPENPSTGTTVHEIIHYDCRRASMDGIERPAQITFEATTIGAAPNDCVDDAIGVWVWQVHRAWTSEADLAQALQETGLVIEHGTLLQTNETGPFPMAWEWSAGRIESQGADHGFSPYDFNANWYFWPHEEGLVKWSHALEGNLQTAAPGMTRDLAGLAATDGVLNPFGPQQPLLTDLFQDVDVRGEFTFYEARDCSS